MLLSSYKQLAVKLAFFAPFIAKLIHQSNETHYNSAWATPAAFEFFPTIVFKSHTVEPDCYFEL